MDSNTSGSSSTSKMTRPALAKYSGMGLGSALAPGALPRIYLGGLGQIGPSCPSGDHPPREAIHKWTPPVCRDPRGRNVVASIEAFQASSTGSNPVGRMLTH